jgi:chromosome segregation ATPase
MIGLKQQVSRCYAQVEQSPPSEKASLIIRRYNVKAGFSSFGLNFSTLIPGPLGESKLNNYEPDILTLKSQIELLKRQLNEPASPTEHQILLSCTTIQRHCNNLQDRANWLEPQLDGISHEFQTQNTKYEKAKAELSLFQEKEQTFTQKLEHAHPKLVEMKRSAETTASPYCLLIQEKKKMALAQIQEICKLQETISEHEKSERSLNVEIK